MCITKWKKPIWKVTYHMIPTIGILEMQNYEESKKISEMGGWKDE